MPMAAFDTMSVAKRLEREFDVPARQAEGFASVLHENFVGNVATKEDLARTEEKLGGEIAAVRKDVEHIEERLTARMEVQGSALKAEISQSVNRAIYTLGGLVTVLFILDRIVPLFGIAR